MTLLCVSLILFSSIPAAGTLTPSTETLALAAPAPVPAHSSTTHDYALTFGQFFPQTGDRPGTGFDVRDDVRDDAGEVISFWTEFNRLGGVEVLGYPISRTYRNADGFTYQLFQRALLQWRPESDVAVFANIMDQLTALGADPWLAGLGIPASIADDGSNGDFAAAVQTRLGWLVEPHIKAFYLSDGSDASYAIELYGLPTSLPARSGPFMVQRFQRVALQVWLDEVPGMPAPGTVVPVLAGDLFRKQSMARGDFSDLRFVPQALSNVATPAAVPGTGPAALSDGLKQPLALLQDNPAGRVAASALTSPGVRIVFEQVPAIAIFSASKMTVAINPEWADADPKALATVLAHEGSHLSDYLGGADMNSSEGCYRTEFVAFEMQARVWAGFYGPNGKSTPSGALDRELNQILDEITHRPDAFNATVRQTYRAECG